MVKNPLFRRIVLGLFCVSAIICLLPFSVSAETSWSSGASTVYSEFRWDYIWIRQSGTTSSVGYEWKQFPNVWTNSFVQNGEYEFSPVYRHDWHELLLTVHPGSDNATIVFYAKEMFLPYDYIAPQISGDATFNIVWSFNLDVTGFVSSGNAVTSSLRSFSGSYTNKQYVTPLFPYINNLVSSGVYEEIGGYHLTNVEIRITFSGLTGVSFEIDMPTRETLFDGLVYSKGLINYCNTHISGGGSAPVDPEPSPDPGVTDVDFTGWLARSVGAFFDLEINDGFTLGGILAAIIGIGLVAYFFKVFG